MGNSFIIMIIIIINFKNNHGVKTKSKHSSTSCDIYYQRRGLKFEFLTLHFVELKRNYGLRI